MLSRVSLGLDRESILALEHGGVEVLPRNHPNEIIGDRILAPSAAVDWIRQHRNLHIIVHGPMGNR